MNTFILTSEYRFDQPWLISKIRDYFGEHSRILVIAFAFYRDEECDSDAFLAKGGKNGCYTELLSQQLSALGVCADQIEVLNFYDDTPQQMRQKIQWANTLIFSGGSCELTYERVCALDLLNDIVSFRGVICGASAGALVQQSRYINFLEGEFVQRKGFGTLPNCGAIIVHNGKCLIGKNVDYSFLTDQFHTDIVMIGDEGAVVINATGVELVGDAKRILVNTTPMRTE